VAEDWVGKGSEAAAKAGKGSAGKGSEAAAKAAEVTVG
jgi:hypothetical protein